MDNNTSNTDQDNEISLTRIFKNSAISFSITEDTNINVIEGYEFKNSTNAQYSLILDASQEITPEIAVGLNPMFNLTSDVVTQLLLCMYFLIRLIVILIVGQATCNLHGKNLQMV